MTWANLSDAPTMTAAQGYYLEDDDEAGKVLHDKDTWLGDILEDNGGEPDGPAWIVFPLDDAAREELRRLRVVGQEVSGYVVEAYTADAHLSDYAEPWMGSTKQRVAFFVSENDARRAVQALQEARADA
jgi:hypothetical protein